MIKKDVNFKWNSINKEYFEKIKVAIAITLALHRLDFSNDFIL